MTRRWPPATGRPQPPIGMPISCTTRIENGIGWASMFTGGTTFCCVCGWKVPAAFFAGAGVFGLTKALLDRVS